MSNFIDIQKIPKPQAVKSQTYEQIFADLKKKLLVISGKDSENIAPVLEMESEPLTMFLQLLAFEKFKLNERINNAVIATFLPYATGYNLDNLAKNYDLNRLKNESDEELRRRCFLSREGLNGHTAGDYYLSYFLNNFKDKIADLIIEAAKFKIEAGILSFTDQQYIGELVKANLKPGYIFAYFIPQFEQDTSKYPVKIANKNTIDGDYIDSFNKEFINLTKSAYSLVNTNKTLMMQQIEREKIQAPNDKLNLILAQAYIALKVTIKYWQKPNTPQDFLAELYKEFNEWAKNASFKLGRNATKTELIALMHKFPAIQTLTVDMGDAVLAENYELISLEPANLEQQEIENWQYLIFWQAEKSTQPPPWLELQFAGYKE